MTADRLARSSARSRRTSSRAPERAAGESPLGDLIADAQLADPSVVTGGATPVVAFMNPGGIRADLTYSAPTPARRPGTSPSRRRSRSSRSTTTSSRWTSPASRSTTSSNQQCSGANAAPVPRSCRSPGLHLQPQRLRRSSTARVDDRRHAGRQGRDLPDRRPTTSSPTAATTSRPSPAAPRSTSAASTSTPSRTTSTASRPTPRPRRAGSRSPRDADGVVPHHLHPRSNGPAPQGAGPFRCVTARSGVAGRGRVDSVRSSCGRARARTVRARAGSRRCAPCRSAPRGRGRAWPAADARARRRCGCPRSSRSPRPPGAAGRG